MANKFKKIILIEKLTIICISQKCDTFKHNAQCLFTTQTVLQINKNKIFVEATSTFMFYSLRLFTLPGEGEEVSCLKNINTTQLIKMTTKLLFTKQFLDMF